MYALIFDRLGRIIFSPVEIPAEFRDELRARFGGEIRAGVSLDYDVLNDHEWPRGADRPEVVLCVSKTDPSHYKVFKYSRQIARDEFEPVGMNFSVIHSGSEWGLFMRTLRQLDDIAAKTDETDTDEMWDEIEREVGTR